VPAIPRIAAWLWLGVGCCAWAAGAPPKVPQSTATPDLRIAHSALLTVDAAPTDDHVAFYIRRSTGQSTLNSSDVTIAVDGKVQSLQRGGDGSYLLPATDLRESGAHAVDITVGHDGIREILSGKLTLPRSTGGSFISEHRQIGWWILNTAIVLIAAIALSRRKS
jgi:hypothetical protein